MHSDLRTLEGERACHRLEDYVVVPANLASVVSAEIKALHAKAGWGLAVSDNSKVFWEGVGKGGGVYIGYR